MNQNNGYGQQPPATQTQPQNDLISYVTPTGDDFTSSGGKAGKHRWTTSARKSDYPGKFDYIVRPVPTPQGRRPLVTGWRHLFELTPGQWFGFNCPLSMRTGGRCLLCEKRSEFAARVTNDIDMKRAEDMAAREVKYMNVILRHDEARGPVVFEAHYTFTNLCKANQEQFQINAFDAQAGIDFMVHVPAKQGDRWGCGNDPRGRSPLHVDPRQVAEWVNATHDLEKEIRCLPYDKQVEAYEKAAGARSFGPEITGHSPQHYQQPPAQQGYQNQPAPQNYGPPPGQQQYSPPPQQQNWGNRQDGPLPQQQGQGAPAHNNYPPPPRRSGPL